jgi:hypothetical protein
MRWIIFRKTQGTLSPVESTSVAKPSCCFALVHPNSGFHWVTSGQCQQSKLKCLACSASFCKKTAVAKMLRQQKTITISNSRAFFNALSHTPELHVQHTKPLQSRSDSAVRVWTISAFRLAVVRQFFILKIFWEKKIEKKKLRKSRAFLRRYVGVGITGVKMGLPVASR